MILLPLANLSATNDASVIGCKEGDVQYLVVQATGTWTGTLQFEGTLDGTTWAATVPTNVTSGTVGNGPPSNGMWRVNVTGLLQARVRLSGGPTGTVVITASLSTRH